MAEMVSHLNTLLRENERLRSLLNEVRQQFTRDDDLPDDLLPRIDAAIDGVPVVGGKTDRDEPPLRHSV